MRDVNIKLSELEVSNRTLGVMRRLGIDTLDEVKALYNKIERGKTINNNGRVTRTFWPTGVKFGLKTFKEIEGLLNIKL